VSVGVSGLPAAAVVSDGCVVAVAVAEVVAVSGDGVEPVTPPDTVVVGPAPPVVVIVLAVVIAVVVVPVSTSGLLLLSPVDPDAVVVAAVIGDAVLMVTLLPAVVVTVTPADVVTEVPGVAVIVLPSLLVVVAAFVVCAGDVLSTVLVTPMLIAVAPVVSVIVDSVTVGVLWLAVLGTMLE
jgi:hypothetical protein